MRKICVFLLAAAMLLSLCACGTDESYRPLEDALEAGNYESAFQELQAMQQADLESREYEYVDITLDNWQEYFTLEELQPIWTTIPAGEGAEEIRQLTIPYGITIREPYRSRVPVVYGDTPYAYIGDDLRVGFIWDVELDYIDVDFDAETYIWGEKYRDGNTGYSSNGPLNNVYSTTGDFFYNGGYSGILVSNAAGNRMITEDGKLYGQHYMNVQITEIQGRLPLLPEEGK